jgi:GNAT superfamily N-acetyltransferase
MFRNLDPMLPSEPLANFHLRSVNLLPSNSIHPFNFDARERSIVARAWTYGWAISRNTDTPIERLGYFQIFVGKPDQTTRYVLPHFDHELIKRLVGTEASPGSWLKVCAPIDRLSPLLSTGWNIHAPEFLMSANLISNEAPIIEGYRVQTESSGVLTFVKLITAEGDLAASGQVAVADSFATFDKIVTAEAHRRRGLGRHVMSILSSLSLDLGVKRGVLVATEEGAALYKALGWSLVSPIAAASHLNAHTLGPSVA